MHNEGQLLGSNKEDLCTWFLALQLAAAALLEN